MRDDYCDLLPTSTQEEGTRWDHGKIRPATNVTVEAGDEIIILFVLL